MYLVRTELSTRSTANAETALAHVRDLLQSGQSPVVTDISGHTLSPTELQARVDRDLPRKREV